MLRLLRARALFAAALLIGGFSAPHGAADSADPPVKPGTAKMRVLLEQLASKARPAENPFLSAERAELMRPKAMAAPKSSASLPFLFSFADELLKAGRNDEALAQFRLVEKLDQSGTPQNRLNTLLNQALCYMRMGELQNCLSNHTSESCLAPIRPGGYHQWPDGSRHAMGILTNLLAEFPDSLSARWMLNVASMTVGDYPDKVPPRWLIPPAAFESDYDIKRFPEIAASVGLADNQLSGGSIADDFDGDGLLDVIVTSIGLRHQMRFFRNQGDGTFSDQTRPAGLTGLTGGLNMVSADFNNDGHLDLVVLRGAWMKEQGRFPKSLLKNNGDGTFEDVTEKAGLLTLHPSQTAVWLDFDGDGWIDLFVGNETFQEIRLHPCELFHNKGDGTFEEMAGSAGVAVKAYVKGVTAADFNNDGRPDLFVSVFRGSNLLFRNDGPLGSGAGANTGWNFTETGAPAGIQQPFFSFPAWFFDYDNDGWEDLYVGGYRIKDVGDIAADYLGLPHQGERPRLYRNRGDGTFADVTAQMGLDHLLHGMGSNFGDLDNDGWLDFYIGTGDPDLLTIVPNRMFRNNEGRGFQDVTTSGGFGHLQKGHAVSFADLDNDGDQDVFEDMGGAVSSDIYPNVLFMNPGHGNHWLKLQLIGVQANRSGIGARLKITLTRPSGRRVIHRTVNTGGSFGCNPLRIELGLGDATAIDTLEIQWPGSGTVQTVAGLQPNRCYVVREGAAAARPVHLKPVSFRLADPHAAPKHH